ncbi:MAG: amino acid-binding protein [Saccharofermentans sp.]|nr:amino acid-binding protein [Saccharofermentans sp.]
MLKQLSIFAENKRGAMNAITSILKENEINITTLVTNDSAEFGIVRMVVDDPTKAFDAMKKNGYLCRIDSVAAVEMQDTFGSLDALLGCITDAYLNLDYLYISFNRETLAPVAILKSTDGDELESFLKGKGYTLL